MTSAAIPLLFVALSAADSTVCQGDYTRDGESHQLYEGSFRVARDKLAQLSVMRAGFGELEAALGQPEYEVVFGGRGSTFVWAYGVESRSEACHAGVKSVEYFTEYRLFEVTFVRNELNRCEVVSKAYFGSQSKPSPLSPDSASPWDQREDC